jgi:transposase-like protein
MTNENSKKFSPEVRECAVRMVLEHKGDKDGENVSARRYDSAASIERSGVNLVSEGRY